MESRETYLFSMEDGLRFIPSCICDEKWATELGEAFLLISRDLTPAKFQDKPLLLMGIHSESGLGGDDVFHGQCCSSRPH